MSSISTTYIIFIISYSVRKTDLHSVRPHARSSNKHSLSSVCSPISPTSYEQISPSFPPIINYPENHSKQNELREHDIGACYLIFSVFSEYNEPLSTWADTHLRVFSKTPPRNFDVCPMNRSISRSCLHISILSSMVEDPGKVCWKLC